MSARALPDCWPGAQCCALGFEPLKLLHVQAAVLGEAAVLLQDPLRRHVEPIHHLTAVRGAGVKLDSALPLLAGPAASKQIQSNGPTSACQCSVVVTVPNQRARGRRRAAGTVSDRDGRASKPSRESNLNLSNLNALRLRRMTVLSPGPSRSHVGRGSRTRAAAAARGSGLSDDVREVRARAPE